MNIKKHTKDVLRTETVNYQTMINLLVSNDQAPRILHALFGLSTEVGELFDQVKRHLFYGQPLHVNNLIEEAGDLSWYFFLLCDAIDKMAECDAGNIFELNIQKLKVRYPEKFTEYKAKVRRLDRESRIFEAKKVKSSSKFINKCPKKRENKCRKND